jgi:transposase
MLTSNETSNLYFSSLRWNGIRFCPRCKCTKLYYCNSNKYSCQRCRYKFSEFTGTYLGKLKIKSSLVAHILYLFASEQPAYKIRSCVNCDISTIERTLRLFRQAIYDKSLQYLQQELSLFRQLGIDEGILEIYRKDHDLEYKKDIDGKEYIIFAIHEIDEFVVVFPISYIKNDISNILKNQLKKKKSKVSEIEDKIHNIFKQIEKNEEFNFNPHGSFYKKNDHIAYAMLDIKNEKTIAYNDVFRGKEGIYIGLDGFWSYIEKWLYHYRGLPKDYFHLYLKEIEFRFNNRKKNMFNQISKLLVEPLPTKR